jgi:tRNA-specific 2-thiouridylase
MCGADPSKDQTYMLYRLSEDVLSMLLLPLADEVKSQVREDAKREGLTVADRPESQEICFIPDGDYASFIEERTGVCPEGLFIDENGNTLGKHKGIIRYTVGQRRGLGISAASRIFVTEINVENNTVTLSPTDKLYSELTVSDIVFSGMKKPCEPLVADVSVKLRYKAKCVPAKVEFFPDGHARVSLYEPVRAVTPGQSAVFYDGDTLIAGGFID